MIFRITEDVFVSRPSADEVVLLHIGSGEYFTLDGVGAHVWSTLEEGPRGLEELVRSVQEVFEVEASPCRLDLATLMGQLSAASLIKQTEE
jgi:Coenzyme PQQ synthesis protein D (PqqD)